MWIDNWKWKTHTPHKPDTVINFYLYHVEAIVIFLCIFWWNIAQLQEIDIEALRILNLCYDHAKEVSHIYMKETFWCSFLLSLHKNLLLYQILQRNRKLMDAVVDELVQKKSLTKQEFFHLVELHGSIKPMPPSILDLRAAKRAEFQEMMMNQKETSTSNF